MNNDKLLGEDVFAVLVVSCAAISYAADGHLASYTYKIDRLMVSCRLLAPI